MSEGARDAIPRTGQMLANKYRVERVVGSGGMGIVLEATHVLLGERVAIKLLHPELGLTGARYVRFVREARAAAGIRSDHVVRVFDLGALADGAPYIAMELLAGVDLATLLERDGRLPVQRAVDYLLQACEGVAEAHARHIVHRDLKPANLFVTRRSDQSPCIKVLDFGISKVTTDDTLTAGDDSAADVSRDDDSTKDDHAPTTGHGKAPPGSALTHTRARLGSPMYSSPEQLRSPKHIDARTDVWSLGTILFELLTAKRAFEAPTYDALQNKIAEGKAPSARVERAEIPEGLDEVVARCIRKRPEERFGDVGDLATALAPFGSDEGARSAARTIRILHAEGGGDAIASPVLDVFGPTVDRRTGTPRSRASRGGRASIVAGAVIAAAVFAGSLLVVRRARDAARHHDERTAAERNPSAPLATSAPAKGRRVFATLDFAPGGASGAEWLGVALGELARQRLTADESIRVVTTEGIGSLGDTGVALEVTSCAALRAALGADVVIAGSFRASGPERDAVLDVRVAAYRAQDGAKLAESEASGRVAEAFGLIDRLVEAIRTPIGLNGLAVTEEEALRKSQPANPEVMRLLAEAFARSEHGDNQGTLRALDAALAIDAGNPRVLVERVCALDNLERDSEIPAATAAALAAIPRLPRAERFQAEARVRVLTEDDAKAAETYEMLASMYPDEPSYAIDLGMHLARAGKHDEAQKEADRLRALPSPFGDDPRVDLLEMEIAMERGDRRRDEAMARKALATSLARGLDAQAAIARFSIARSLIAQGDNANVTPWIEAARADFERLGDTARMANVLVMSSRVERRNLDLAGARADLEKALDLERTQGALQRQATVLLDLATAASIEGDHRRSKALAGEGLALARRAAPAFGGTKWTLAAAGSDVLRAMLDLGDVAMARKAMAEHVEEPEVKGNAAERVFARALLGRAMFEGGALEDAKRTLEEARDLYEKDARRANAVGVSTTLADVEVALGDAEKGESIAASALATAVSLGQPVLAEAARLAHGRALLALSRARESESEARAALEVVRGRALDMELEATTLLAEALAARGEPVAALATLKDASARFALGQRPFVLIRMKLAEARALAAAGETGSAKRIAWEAESGATKSGMKGLAVDARRAAADQAGKTR